MTKVVRFIVISNAIALMVVVLVERVTAFFGIRFWSDYAFYVLIAMWGMAALLFMYPPLGGMTPSDARADRVADSMVERHAADDIDDERFSANTLLCLKLFAAGVPAFVICMLASFVG
ncbi:hypothetical protein [Vibrio sp. CAU 1672]|uniref:hypothetical protein n=1 Tax=Vibrio sp. CAU 1672 TaxID=3032594 RepID=UPI0023DA5C2C|nr:hypothetical protein [Vibrio sp. CAU 1672]MDF2154578.1 hypothetical protein [Vibrio sp. CAU 1672]